MMSFSALGAFLWLLLKSHHRAFLLMPGSTLDCLLDTSDSAFYVEVVSKPHLRPNGCVAPRIEMLTYSRVRSAFNSRDALPLSLI
jgi:hypothetical protein